MTEVSFSKQRSASITPVQHPTVGTWEDKSQNCYCHDTFGERSYQHLATLFLTQVFAIISELGGTCL